MKLKKTLASVMLLGTIGFSAVSQADDHGYAYMRFDISNLSKELKGQMKVLGIVFSPDVNYGKGQTFKINDKIVQGTEGGFLAEGGVWGASMTVTVGTADWQHYCLIEATVSNNGSKRFPGDNFFGQWKINWQQSKNMNCAINPSGKLIQLLNIAIN
ncbi:hypothetical protein BH10PSE19_BH10PSE19_04020 [soil metagenome]